LGPEILGAQVATDGSDGAVRLRGDAAPWRIAIHPGDRDQLLYLGWEVGEPVDAAVERLEAAGVDVRRGAAAGGERPVRDVVWFREWFRDLFGFRHELAPALPVAAPFAPGRAMGGFVTGNLGLGHVVLIVPDLEALAFFREVLGFRLSDSIETFTSLRFLHCPGSQVRHHSVALASVPGMVGFHHLMLEVHDLDDFGRAYDLVRERGLPSAMDLGRHTNDLMTSSYVRTPSGFELEYGTGGVVIDDNVRRTATYDAPDLWGHHPPASGPLPPGIITAFVPEGASA
jgi:3,4-dihydroxy-9,10-secoandrosta-1,3,5(10)-triene-9,17-dione 4,5-dioxygenase